MSHRRRTDWALLAVVATGVTLAGVLAYLLVWYSPEEKDVSWRVVTYEVGDRERIRVTFEVDKPAPATAECQISAFDADGKSAGRLTGIVVAPREDGGRRTTLTVLVPTPETPAVRAGVAQCVLTG